MHALAEALAGSADKEPLEHLKQVGFPTAAFAVLTLGGGWKSVEHGAAHLTGFWTPHE
jgi:phosphohistidine phosphatase